MNNPTTGTKPKGAVSTLHEPSKRPTDKAHTVALALHRAGYGVGHGVIADVTMPRMIRPYTVARRAS